MKFKVGDRVKVVGDNHGYTKDCKYFGNTYTISGINTNGFNKNPHYSADLTHILYEDDLALARDNKIVITTDGEKTLVRLYEGDKVIESATAKCSPDDTFDFETGARIAFDRLFAEEKKEEKPKIKVGDRVKVVDSGKAYTHYVSWFEKNAPEHLSHYAYDKSIECGTIGTVKKIAKHLDCNTQLYAISVGYMDTIYLINEDGIERA